MRHPLLAIAVLIIASGLGMGSVDFADMAQPGPIHADEPGVQPEKSEKDQPDRPRRGRRPGRGRRRPPTTGPSTQPTSGPATQPATQPATHPATAPASQPTTKPAEPADRYFAVTGGIVHTVSGSDRRDVTILCKNGKILAIGRDLELPEGTKTLDATGMHVYPGLVACESRRIVGSEPPQANTDVFSTNMTLALAGGLTTVVTGNTAAKTTFGTLEDHVLRGELFVKLSFRNSTQKRGVREALAKVRQYLREKEVYEKKKAEEEKAEKAGKEITGKKAVPPDEAPVKGPNAKYLQLIKKEKVAFISVDSRRDLVDVCRLAEDFDIRVVLRGAAEGWTLAGRLGRAGVKAIVTPRRIPARDERLNRPSGGSIENAAALHDHGVEIAVIALSSGTSLGGLAGRDLINLPMEAAHTVRGGLPEQAAIESITLGAARVLGIDDRVGSIEIGKDADFAVCDGRLLDFFTTVQWTVVNGRIAYDKATESLFADIRPRTSTTQPAAYKFWPRPFKREGVSE